MPRIKELTTYTGALNQSSIYFAVDGDSFSRGMKLSGAQVFAMCKGTDGKNIELRATASFIQWRQEGSTSWANLISVSDLKGADGKELEIRVNGGYIQTRLTGGAWANLITLADLKGEKGDPAENPNFTFVVSALAWDATPTTNITGVYPNLTVNLGVPKGKDAESPVFTFAISALEWNETPTASVTGTYPNLSVNLGIPKGKDAANPVFTTSATKVNAGENPEASVSGAYPNLALEFKIPEGQRGLQGKPLVVLSNGNYGNWDEDSQTYVDSGVAASATVDLENVPVDFTEAAIRENIQTGETVPTVFGKLKKWFNDLGALAWKNKIDYDTDINNLPSIPDSQIQSNWSQTNASQKDFIQNKPTVPTKTSELTNDSGFATTTSVTNKIDTHNADATAHNDIRTRISGVESNHYNHTQSDERYVQKEAGKGLYPAADATKLAGVEAGAQKNKPSVDKSATLAITNWVQQGDSTYNAIIYDTDILENSKIAVMPANVASYDIYAEAAVFGGTSSVGQILLRAKNAPSGAMSVNYSIGI